jgi:phosphoribosylanthranilate isomerase
VIIAPGSGLIKICSLRQPEQAACAAAAGANFFGLNFAPVAWRRVTIDEACAISAVAEVSGGGPAPIGVFLDQSTEEINAIASAVGLAFAQIHIHDTPIDWAAIEHPVIPVFRPTSDDDMGTVGREIDSVLIARPDITAVLLDAYSPTTVGGAGVVGNWDVAAGLSRHYPIMLAGGLTPENVAKAIATVRPMGVDVSSGVETDKVKDRVRIQAFVTNARAAFAAL